jgi:hypothetical protein
MENKRIPHVFGMAYDCVSFNSMQNSYGFRRVVSNRRYDIHMMWPREITQGLTLLATYQSKLFLVGSSYGSKYRRLSQCQLFLCGK